MSSNEAASFEQGNRTRRRHRDGSIELNLIAGFAGQHYRMTLLLIMQLLFIATRSTTFADATQAKSSSMPYAYTRLRFDFNSLVLGKRFQLNETWREKEHQLVLKEKQNNENVTVKYYVNNETDLSQLNEDDFIVEAIDQVYLSRLYLLLIYDYDKPEDMQNAANPKRLNAERCARELAYLETKMKTMEESHAIGRPASGMSPELLTFLDATSSGDAGLLFGNFYWPGRWEECAKLQLIDTNLEEPISFTGRFCIASLRSPNWMGTIERKVKELKDRDYFRTPEQPYDYKRYFRIQQGLCLPESCHSLSMDKHKELIRRLATYKLHVPQRDYELSGLFCLPDNDSPLRKPNFEGNLLLLFVCTWLLAALLATGADLAGVRDRQPESSLVYRLVCSLSLKESWTTLVKLRKEAPKVKQTPAVESTTCDGEKQVNNNSGDNSKLCQEETNKQEDSKKVKAVEKLVPKVQDLYFLNAVKVLIMLIIVWCHTGTILQFYRQDPLDFDTTEHTWIFHIFPGATFYVDWFFCMTGFTLTYIMFVSRAVWKNTTVLWLYSIFHRYWRLAPCYLLYFWFCRSLLKLTGSGAFWDYGTSNMTQRAICERQSWLGPITLTQNMHPLHQECIMPSWYLANDMQFYLITPALLYLLARKPLAGWLLILGLTWAGVAGRFHKYLTDPHIQPVELIRARMDLIMRNNWDAHALYLYPQYRIAPYLVGILAGHHAYMVRSGSWPNSPLSGKRASFWLKVIGWSGLACCIYMQWSTMVLYELYPRSMEPHAKIAAAFFYSSMHFLSGIGSACLFTALLFGLWPSVRKLFERPLFTLVSRINFFVYLFQVEMMHYLIQSEGRHSELNVRQTISTCLWVSAWLYSYAIAATLLFGNPIARLETEFVGKLFGQKKRPSGGQTVGCSGQPAPAESTSLVIQSGGRAGSAMEQAQHR